MILTNDDVTKVSEVEKLPLVLCFNYLSYKKDEFERQKRELDKIKNNSKWRNM